MFEELFVLSSLSPEHLASEIGKALGWPVANTIIHGGKIEAEVRANDDVLERDLSDFLDWPYELEAEAMNHSVSEPEFIQAIARIMRAVQSAGGHVVAATDWDAQLPGGGRLDP